MTGGVGDGNGACVGQGGPRRHRLSQMLGDNPSLQVIEAEGIISGLGVVNLGVYFGGLDLPLGTMRRCGSWTCRDIHHRGRRQFGMGDTRDM